jgi:hypothetical protein
LGSPEGLLILRDVDGERVAEAILGQGVVRIVPRDKDLSLPAGFYDFDHNPVVDPTSSAAHARAWLSKVDAVLDLLRDDGTVAKASVDYRPAEGERRCGVCSMFREPRSCTLVRGDIDPAFTCDRWEAA